MTRRHAYDPSKDAALHTRRALRSALLCLREEAVEAVATASRVLDTANLALVRLDSDESTGRIPAPVGADEAFGRVERWTARVDALLMAAYSAETGNTEDT